MDNTIRRQEKCIVGLPSCGYVFSSTRSCFIAYGFKTSPLEMTVLKNTLQSRNIETIEAGGSIAPGRNAFCTKICSKIICSQFCVVILNDDIFDNKEIPNANVNVEYGLMLGFNKYIIPFQHESQSLPFNVAGLDTIKYSDRSFESQAATAIDQAISETTQDHMPSFSPDQMIEAFLLGKGSLICNIQAGDQAFFDMGRQLGYLLLTDFSGMQYIYFGNFTALRREIIIWRIRTLCEILDKRFSSTQERFEFGVINTDQAKIMSYLNKKMEIWILVTSEEDKDYIRQEIIKADIHYPVNIYSYNDINNAFK